jgi:polysaccharide pyruvyl transferase WcaK-like protein
MLSNKIVVWGATYTNKGSLAMLETLSEMYPDDAISIVCDHVSDESVHDSRFHSIGGIYGFSAYVYLLIKIIIWRVSFKYFFKEDHVVSELINTDKFIDLSGFALTEDFSKNSCTYRGTVYLLQALISRVITTKYYIFPQALGPIERPINKVIFLSILYLSCKTFVRGRRSFEFANNFRVSNSILTSDLVFMNNSYRDKNITVLDEAYILINPNSRIYVKQNKAGKTDYIDKLITLITEFSKKYHVVLTPNEIREHEVDDLDICHELFSKLAENSNVSVNSNVEISHLLALCEHAEFSVVSRFHLMIFCLLKGTLPIVISWSEKYLDIMEEFNLQDYVFSEDVFDTKMMDLNDLDEKKAAIRLKSDSIFAQMNRDMHI